MDGAVGRATSATWIDAAISPGRLGHHEAPDSNDTDDEAIQVRGSGAGPGSVDREVHDVAARGIVGQGQQLPYLEQIQSAFGRHDVRGATAHQDMYATAACEVIGAEAYATGTHVAFRQTPDLYTAAHEAAHTVQQRGGVQLKGGVSTPGDPYEKAADEVAKAVVEHRSAEPMLDQYAEYPEGASGSSASQQSAAPRSGTSTGVPGLQMKWNWPGFWQSTKRRTRQGWQNAMTLLDDLGRHMNPQLYDNEGGDDEYGYERDASTDDISIGNEGDDDDSSHIDENKEEEQYENNPPDDPRQHLNPQLHGHERVASTNDAFIDDQDSINDSSYIDEKYERKNEFELEYEYEEFICNSNTKSRAWQGLQNVQQWWQDKMTLLDNLGRHMSPNLYDFSHIDKKKEYEKDGDFICDKKIYSDVANMISYLQELTKDFDAEIYIIGNTGQNKESRKKIEANNAILERAIAYLRSRAEDLINDFSVKNVDLAYKQLVGAVDKYDDFASNKFRNDKSQPAPQSTYALRTALMLASQADGVGLPSWSVYTKGGKPKGNIWPFVERSKNWLPEALGARAKWMETAFVKANELAKSKNENAAILLKGGFGAGKTRLINEKFGDHGSGAIAPDKAKSIDRRANPDLPHASAHVHGSQAAYQLINELIKKQNGTAIYDSSLSYPNDVINYLKLGEKYKKKIIIYDVARKDEARFLSVLKRPVKGEDPRIPPEFIIESAIRDKINRLECMKVVLNYKPVSEELSPEYHFNAGDEKGWNTSEVMILRPGKVKFLSKEAKDRLLLEGIMVDVVNSKISLLSNIVENDLQSQYANRFEETVREIKKGLSQEEQTTLDVFDRRIFRIKLMNDTIEDAGQLYLALSPDIQESIPRKSFENAVDSIKEETRRKFFESIKSKSEFTYEDIPLRVALVIHQNLKTDPWLDKSMLSFYESH